MSIAYGIETKETDDPYIFHAERTMEAVNTTMAPGAFLVDTFPWMLHLPESIAKWKREGMERFRINTEMFESLLRSVKAKMASASC